MTLEGKLSHLGGRCPVLTFTLDKESVRTDAQTRFNGGNCDDVEKNSKVEVTGVRQTDDVVLATRVSIGRGDDDDDND